MTDLRHQLQTNLDGQYRIDRELGSGGMSRVFVAEERSLGREIVLKALPAEFGGEVSVERFTREIQTAARLQHPHIVPLFSAGDAAGVLYYTMPMVEGESLRSRLMRVGQLSAEDAVRVATDVGGALAYAHERGIVHRDIKPENILLSAGHALILDFGIARALDLSRMSAAVSLTQTGVTIGTPMYMSPEQAAGDGTIDARSDIYSLGAVLYEMLAGQPPFSGGSAAVVIAKRFTEAPPSLKSIDPRIPAELQAVVERAMALEPNDRFATAADFVSALRAPSPARAASRSERSIAVLPFANMSADPNSEYFSDGITEEITSALGHLPGLRVAARTSAYAFKGGHSDVSEIGAKLRVSTVLEGSVRQAGSHLRITAQLINVADGFQVWSARYDREMVDVFAIQDEIARAIAKELELKLTGTSAEPLVRRGTDNLEAYDLYLKGRFFWSRRGPWLNKAKECFDQAVAADPSFALAQAGVADCQCILALYGYISSRGAFERARAVTALALALDDRCSEAHQAAGLFELTMGWDLARGERELRRAAELNPSSAAAWAWLGILLSVVGRHTESLEAIRRAVQIEPVSTMVNTLASLGFLLQRAWSDAAATAYRAIELDPTSAPGSLVLGFVHYQKGDLADAISTLERASELSDRAPFMTSFWGAALARAGRANEARAILDDFERNEVDAWFRATIHWALGEDVAAFALIERAFAERNAMVLGHSRSPTLEGLVADPRWRALLRAAGLEQTVAI